jgi:hypothetical protein
MNRILTERVRASQRASFTELVENHEGIILDLDSLHYYALNAAGVFLWKQLRHHCNVTANSLGNALAEAFDIEPSLAQADVQAFLRDLKINRLVSETDETPQLTVEVSPSAVTRMTGYEAPELKASYSLSQVALSGSTNVGPSSAISGS